MAWKGEYDPFGKVTETVNIVEQNIRFPGQYFDSETELHYNYFRTYDPNNGRYIESDPIGLDGGINTYAYVMGNPISFIDPSGTIGFLAAIPFLGGAGGSTAVGGGLTVGKAVTGGILTGIMLSIPGDTSLPGDAANDPDFCPVEDDDDIDPCEDLLVGLQIRIIQIDQRLSQGIDVTFEVLQYKAALKEFIMLCPHMRLRAPRIPPSLNR